MRLFILSNAIIFLMVGCCGAQKNDGFIDIPVERVSGGPPIYTVPAL